MTRLLTALAAALAAAGSASAQYQQPYYQPSPFYQTPGAQPNIYNPQNQPLSPYLNLLRGGNAGVNYYYGVRPGTAGGTGFGLGAPFTTSGATRQPFFPQLANAPDPLQPVEVGVGNVLPPAGHPVVYNNTLGYFPSPFGNRGGSRSGIAGIGASGSAPKLR
ncbi:hypothetical protein [Frigoriglobus tundricola]|uniref:Uncharacterized protein n=1 Tax=Frigoriglobus tundricola TaxID=2774151 RepID=A0A6M5Z0H9_9BACT|nr:hypothetical protein [Frigoriglobus tundricola]QJW99304.1 hypothetical protein FTUN_6907 [Frigoriglobus tundricola]